ncbi:TPA: hypothetical protein L9K96_004952 [Klebsiella quasipneumoniae subsp. quasipneumoniae]|nr:hypothetical protein [Klebsiella quasipneumoniae subsp. quasipneumoniae]
MTKSTITRDRAQQILLGNGPEPSASEERELARMALAAMDSEPVAECEKLATENFRTAMEGIGHIRRTLDETFGGLHGTHVEPDVLDECKAICDAIYAAYRHTQPATVVPDEKDKTVDADDHPLLWSFNEGWNACRAAMLAAAPQEVKDGK